ncbi:MAG: sugar ABC transporter permease [Chloroflexota bacterium]
MTRTTLQPLEAEVSQPMTVGTNPNPKRRIIWTNYLYIVPILVFAAVFFYYPIGYSAGVSTLDWNGVSAKRENIGLQNYQDIFTRDLIVRRALGNQLLFGAVVIIGQMVLGLTMAILLKSRARLKTLYKVIFFLPVVLSSTVAAYVFRRIYDGNTGELNQMLRAVGLAPVAHAWLADPNTALIALMVINMWQWTGFSFMMYYAGLTQIDEEIYEAARIDGANFFQIITRIVIPLLRSTHFSLIVLGVIGVLKTFDIVFLVTQGGPARSTEFLSTYIFKRGLLEFDAGYASALAILMIILALILTVFQLRSYAASRRG